MRVLLAAPFDGHTASYIATALKDQGCTVKRFPYRDLAAVLGPAKMGEHLESQSEGFDFVLILKGELIPPEVIGRISKRGTKVALWSFDPRDGKEEWVLERAKSADFFFTIAKGLVAFYRGMGINAHWLLEACDPFAHQPLGVKEDAIVPVSFIGTVTDVLGREQWLQHVHDHFGADKMAIWGSFCPPRLRDVYRGRAQGDSGFCEAVSQSLVNLGADRNPEIDRSYGARLFRTLAARGYLLTNDTQGIYQDFSGYVSVYRNTPDCLKQIQWALEHPEQRALIAQRGRDFVLRQHTFKNRMEELVGIVTK